MTPASGSASRTGRVRLGELLVKAGVITDTQLRDALQDQVRWGGKLGDILVRMHYVSEDIFVRALSKQLGLPRTELKESIPPEVLGRIPLALIEEHEVLPVAVLDEGKTLAIATSDPLNFTILDHIRALSGVRIVPWVAGASLIREAIARYFHGIVSPVSDDNEALQIVQNSEDGAMANNLDPVALASAPPGPASYPVHPNMMPPAYPASYPPAMMAQMYQGGGVAYTPTATPRLFQAPMPSVPPPMYGSPARPIPADDPQRPLKALVELLVQKGVISLDEYLARLKR